MMFVSLPVTDLERSKKFYEAIGGTLNPMFSDHNSACIVIEEDHNYFMLTTRDFLQTFTELPLGDPAKNPYTSISLFQPTRDDVDALVAKAIAAGGSEQHEPADYGFMYQRGVLDPDGNAFEFGWMDPKAAAMGPEAFAAEQGQGSGAQG